MSGYKSNLNPAFRSKFSEDIFNLKYKHEGAETWDQLASTLVTDVCGEFLQKDDVQRLYEIIRDMKFCQNYLSNKKRKHPRSWN